MHDATEGDGMSGTEATGTATLTYDVFVNDPPPQDGVLPNGEPKRFSPMASTLIYGSSDAVLTDPGMTEEQARVLGDWVAGKGRSLTDIFITHGHGDHWFAAGLLAERFGARIVASAGRSSRCAPTRRRGRCCGTRCTPGSRRRPSPR
jgi:glyoxylase-like metal-dependent hydrolase (beta-lactamase superfamily II)